MHAASVEINTFASPVMGPDFYLEIFPFKTKSRDPFEKKTKNRFELRTALYNYLKDKKNFVFEDALDLRNVPQKIGVPAKDFYSSLSHTEDVGVFVLDSAPVGVDFENRARILKPIVERVCEPKEVSLDPNFQLLWSIKEAAFKSVPFIIQPKAVTEITVTSLITATDEKIPFYKTATFTTTIKTSSKRSAISKIDGICIFNDDYQLAIAKSNIEF